MAFEHETLLNKYYNLGKFNSPDRIGHVMSEIRKLRPATVRDWYLYYVENIRSRDYIKGLARQFFESVPAEHGITYDECLRYMCNVMFARTFAGYNKEQKALRFLRNEISPNIRESTPDMDNLYFVDFCLFCENGHVIGLQLKPETFYTGHYENVVRIEEKMAAFRRAYEADTFFLRYKPSEDPGGFALSNPEVVSQIQHIETENKRPAPTATCS